MVLVTKANKVQPQKSMWIFIYLPFVKQLSLRRSEDVIKQGNSFHDE